jgi:dipeptidyl aminopeptidase/acylaminoacyl peptidase
MRPVFATLFWLALSASPPLSAAASPSPSPANWTAEDLVHAEDAADWTLAADGAAAAWVQSEVVAGDSGEQAVAHVWLARLNGNGREAGPSGTSGPAVRLTRGIEQASHPRFSPDSRRLAFLSNRAPAGGGGEAPADGTDQVWILPLAGGEAYPATHFDRDVQDFAWIDARTLVVLAAESPSERERKREENSDTAIVVDDAENEPAVRLFRVEIEEDGGALTPQGEIRRLTTNRDWINALAVAPDGKRAVATAARSLSYDFDQRVRPRTLLIDLSTGAETDLFADGPAVVPEGLRWAPDSSGFYFTEERSTHPTYRMATVTDLWFYDLASRAAQRIDLGWPRGLAAPVEPLADGFLALLADGVRYRPARFARNRGGFKRQDLSGTHVKNLDAWTLSGDGKTLVYEHSTATRPPQGFAAKLDGTKIVAERRITALNAGWEDKPTGRSEIVHWKGAKGDTVEGILRYPLDWKVGEKRPLVLAIHGGPNETDRDSWAEDWSAPEILLRDRGAFVLSANYHGSAGYGLEWVESIAGRYYELEVPDLEKGVDALIARGLVDPEKLGSLGWSNGGILTAELITRTHRYKAASIGAADVEWISDWGNVDFGAAFDNYYFGGPPWEKLDHYIQKSPFFRLKDVTTPTIAYAGTADRSVPPDQSWSLFRALQQLGKAPTRLVLFPGEPHALIDPAHQQRKIEEDLAWFDRYLFQRTSELHPAVPEGSALAGLLAKKTAARQGAAWGLLFDGALIPETAPHDGQEVGRFEVTRAQFAAFDPAAPALPGEENLPAIEPFERAKSYAAWLAKKSGQDFRLPTEDEAQALADEAGTGGNTLDTWVGYTPNPDDLAAIRGVIEQAFDKSGAAPLLEPAGSHPGLGEGSAALFDLDGNAAEWAVADSGKGVAIGPSAERPNDPRSKEPASPAYTGFRVVVSR